MTPDFDESDLWTYLLKYTKLLWSYHGRQWLESNKRSKAVIASILNDIQSIFRVCAQLGETPAYREAVKNNHDLSPDILDVPRAVVKDIMMDLTSTMGRGHAGQYLNDTVLGQIINPNSSSAIPSGGSPNGRNKRSADTPPETSDTPPKKTKKDSMNGLSDADKERFKTLGILLWSKQDRLPLCSVFTKKNSSASTEERCCMHFMTQGFFCNHPRCNRPHIANIRKFSTEKQTEFAAFVTATDGLEFAPGKGPAGASP